MKHLVFIGFFLMTLLGQASQALLDRPEVESFIHKMVKEHGFKERGLRALFAEVRFQPQVIESITKPYEKKPWDVYKEIFLTSERLQAGLDYWRKNQKNLNAAEKYYHVPAQIIVAILGVETLYGQRQGSYSVLDALATLAFDYPPRSAFFTKELGEYLLLCREQGVDPRGYRGSYAGAIGMPQFMPSSYRFYAANFSGTKDKDLVNDNAAVIASVANYLHKHGWAMWQPVAVPANISGFAYKKIDTSHKNAQYGAKEMVRWGVKPQVIGANQPKKAGLVELNLQNGRLEHWMAYPNFYVIMRYNSSPQYALVVYLLARQLKENLKG